MSEYYKSSKKLPLFPLQLVLFPDEQIPLHIFEERYKQMIKDCLKKEKKFGITSFINNKLSKIGCLCHIEEIVKIYSDDSMDVICQGGDRFLIHKYFNDRMYMEATITYFHDLENSEGSLPILDEIKPLLHEMITLADDGLENKMPNLSLLNTSFRMAHYIGLELNQKQNLLEIQSETERLLFIKKHLDDALPRIRGYEEMKNRIKSNGHFKKLPPISFKNN